MVNSAGHRSTPSGPMPALDVQALLAASGVATRLVEYGRAEIIFSQGDASRSVMYIRAGSVKLSVRSRIGREAVVAVLGPGDFFGQGCLTGQPRRTGSATAIAPSAIHVISKTEMIRLLREQRTLSDHFISYMLASNVRIEEDLIDQLFDSIEKRLARALLLLARYGTQDRPRRVLPGVSQEALAAMAGTTQPRISFFMDEFRRLGFIDGERGCLTINHSLLSVVLHD